MSASSIATARQSGRSAPNTGTRRTQFRQLITRTAKPFVFSAALILLGGCSTVYFHDADREKAFTEAQQHAKKSNPIILFKDQRAFFAKLKEDEEKATKDHIIARRDWKVARYIEGTEGGSAWEKMRFEIAGRAMELYGKNWKKPKVNFLNYQIGLQFFSDRLNPAIDELASAKAEYLEIAKKKKLPKKYQCPYPSKPIDRKENPHKSDSKSWDAYKTLASACARYLLARKKRDQTENSFIDGAEDGSLVANVGKEFRQNLKAYKQQIDQAETARERFSKLLEKLNELMKESKEKEAKEAVGKFFYDTLAKLEPLGQSQSFTAIADLIESVLKDEAKEIAYKKGGGAEGTKDGGLAGARILASTLITLQKELSGLDSQAKFESLTIELAYYRYRAALAAGEVAFTKRLISIKRERLRAIAKELALLSAAYNAGTPSRADCAISGFARLMKECDPKKKMGVKIEASKALAGYSASWARGRLPYEISLLREAQANREWALAREEQRAAVWTGMLMPVINQLVAYGKGGIKMETIVELLKILAIGAVAAR